MRTRSIRTAWIAYTCCSIEIPFARPRATPCHRRRNPQFSWFVVACSLAIAVALGGVFVEPVDAPPPTIVPAPGRGVSAGDRRAGGCGAADARRRARRRIRPGDGVVGGAQPRCRRAVGPDDRSAVGTRPHRPAARRGDGDDGRRRRARRTCRRGAATSRFDVAAGAATRVEVEDQQATEFTAIARRADGKLVLGSADGAVYTLSSADHGGRATARSSPAWMPLSHKAIRLWCWTAGRRR